MTYNKHINMKYIFYNVRTLYLYYTILLYVKYIQYRMLVTSISIFGICMYIILNITNIIKCKTKNEYITYEWQ